MPIEYQQGQLFGYEVREYLLEKWQRRCVYCGATNTPLQIEHLVAKSRGGSNRVSNLTLSCKSCNEKKANRPLEDFVKSEATRGLLLNQAKAPLRDAAALNSIRNAIGNSLRQLGVVVSCWSGGLTKFNRCQQGYPKSHWIDAACIVENLF